MGRAAHRAQQGGSEHLRRLWTSLKKNRSSAAANILLRFLKLLALCLLSIGVLVSVLLGSNTKQQQQQSTPSLSSFIHSSTSRELQALVVDSSSLSREDEYEMIVATASLKGVKGCADDMVDYVPGYDHHHKLPCIVRPPKGYRLPPKWPASKAAVWTSNVVVGSIERDESGINILLGEKTIQFRGGGYADKLERMLARGSNKSFSDMGIRVVLDVGITGEGGELASHDRLLTLSISGYKPHGSPVQLALERGLPGMIGFISTLQLPYPLSSFDMLHCKHCGVEWQRQDGSVLLEANRLLRPGGYFVWTSPTDTSALLKAMSKRICWNQVAQEEQTVIWQKTFRSQCYVSRSAALCEAGMHNDNVDSALGQQLKTCIVQTPRSRWRPVHKQRPWPNRLTMSPRRLARYVSDPAEYNEEAMRWSSSSSPSTGVSSLWALLNPVIFSDHPKRPADDDPTAPANLVRNVMDMNAGYGGFNAALLAAGKTVWVMNVVPTTAANNTLPVVYERGLIGAQHDWCQAFPTYPRSYDLVYASKLLSQELKQTRSCFTLPAMLLEVDRLLRPEGWLLLLDDRRIVEAARLLLMQMRWETRVVELAAHDDQLLVVGQKNWRK